LWEVTGKSKASSFVYKNDHSILNNVRPQTTEQNTRNNLELLYEKFVGLKPSADDLDKLKKSRNSKDLVKKSSSRIFPN